MSKYKQFLVHQVPELLKELTPNHHRFFGQMTAQHMIEHLVWVTKSTVKYTLTAEKLSTARESLTEGQLKFMSFVEKGARFKHRPGNKTKDDLPQLKMPSLESAVLEIPKAINRLYTLSRDAVFINPIMGILTFDQMELFHYNHFKYHLQHQFGLGIY